MQVFRKHPPNFFHPFFFAPPSGDSSFEDSPGSPSTAPEGTKNPLPSEPGPEIGGPFQYESWDDIPSLPMPEDLDYDSHAENRPDIDRDGDL